MKAFSDARNSCDLSTKNAQLVEAKIVLRNSLFLNPHRPTNEQRVDFSIQIRAARDRSYFSRLIGQQKPRCANKVGKIEIGGLARFVNLLFDASQTCSWQSRALKGLIMLVDILG